MSNNKNSLPSKKSIEDAIKVIEDFRAVCRHQMDLGYWATVDFPSKHHINKILQLQYTDYSQIESVYGAGLSKRIKEMVTICKSYIAFLRE
jgi:hypothetical protein